MKTFNVTGNVTVSCWTEVEAETAEEAKEIALKRGLAEFHIDGTYQVDECWRFDCDGEPVELYVEEKK